MLDAVNRRQTATHMMMIKKSSMTVVYYYIQSYMLITEKNIYIQVYILYYNWLKIISILILSG